MDRFVSISDGSWSMNHGSWIRTAYLYQSVYIFATISLNLYTYIRIPYRFKIERKEILNRSTIKINYRHLTLVEITFWLKNTSLFVTSNDLHIENFRKSQRWFRKMSQVKGGRSQAKPGGHLCHWTQINSKRSSTSTRLWQWPSILYLARKNR